MNEAVDRLIEERSRLDRGFPQSLVLSIAAHGMLVAAALLSAFLLPKKPLLNTANVFAVPIPRGGAGSLTAKDDPGPAAPKPDPQKAEVPTPKPKREIIKPPKPEEKKGLPMPDAKKGKPIARPTAPPASGGGGTGKGTEIQGVGIGHVHGPGLPEGVDVGGDIYMGGVAMKIARLWRSQIRQEIQTPVVIRFTILADGSVTDVQIVQTSGVYLLDSAARSAVATAAPFTPLPKHYDTDLCNASRCTIQARFAY